MFANKWAVNLIQQAKTLIYNDSVYLPKSICRCVSSIFKYENKKNSNDDPFNSAHSMRVCYHELYSNFIVYNLRDIYFFMNLLWNQLHSSLKRKWSCPIVDGVKFLSIFSRADKRSVSNKSKFFHCQPNREALFL